MAVNGCEVPITRPAELSACTSNRVYPCAAGIAVSNPDLGAEASVLVAPALLTPSTRQLASSVAPFQLA